MSKRDTTLEAAIKTACRERKPTLRWIHVVAPVCLADHIAETPFEHRIAVMAHPTSTHCYDELKDRVAALGSQHPRRPARPEGPAALPVITAEQPHHITSRGRRVARRD